jgi:hypothetical protein
MGIAQRVLGKVQQARGQYTDAEACLQDALQTFTTTSAHFEVGRTHLALAELAHLQGNHPATTLHFNHAYTLFQRLQIPCYVERTSTRATMLGVSLTPENGRSSTPPK